MRWRLTRAGGTVNPFDRAGAATAVDYGAPVELSGQVVQHATPTAQHEQHLQQLMHAQHAQAMAFGRAIDVIRRGDVFGR